MALTVSATDSEVTKPVNTIFQQTLLRRARRRAPYFIGSRPGEIERRRGTATCTWRRYANLLASTTALSELTGNASYGQGRTPATLSVTDVTATMSKYGNFIIENEEVDVFTYNAHGDEVMGVMGENAGHSLNILQRNLIEDNATAVYSSNAASAGAVIATLAATDLQVALNALDENSAEPFAPMTTGSQNVGTSPILPAFWGICHPDLARDIAVNITGFTSVEKYAGQVDVVSGEFGAYGLAGVGIRFVSTPLGGIDTGAGASVTSQDVYATSGSADVYNLVILGRDAIGSVGLGEMYPDGVYRAGDDLGPVEIIAHGLGSGGTSDPYSEVATVAWKAWWTGAVLNGDWARVIRTAATNINN